MKPQAPNQALHLTPRHALVLVIHSSLSAAVQVSFVVRLSIRVVGASRQEEWLRRGGVMRRKSGWSRQAVTVGCHWAGLGGGSDAETEPNAAPDRRLMLFL